MAAALTIGEFSRITHLGIKTLRRYHEAGLLEPAHVDQHTGYRYYSLDQVPTAQVIHRFRQLGMPVREVGALVAVTDPDARAALVAQHLDRLETHLGQTRAAVISLRRLLQPDPAPLEVHRRQAEAATVAAVRDVVGLSDVLAWYNTAMSELDAVLGAAGAIRTGPPGGLYDNELFTEERGAIAVYIPVADPPSRGAVAPLTIRPPTWPPRSTSARTTTSTSPTQPSAPTSASKPSKSQDPCVRSTTSGPAIPMTAPDGARKSAGQSFKLQPERFSGRFPPQNRTPVASATGSSDPISATP
jgi:DNA-binding transcriptional MerR regulator